MIDHSQYKLKNIGKWLLAAFIAIPFIKVIYLAWLGIAISLMPLSYWIEYRGAQSVKDYYSPDEALTMVSYYQTFRETELSFHDILYCDWGKGDVSVSEQIFRRTRLDRIEGLESGINWVYDGKRPNKKSQCYIKAVVTLGVGYAKDKRFEVQTNKFILDCESKKVNTCKN